MAFAVLTFLTNWLEQYGYWILFVALLLEMLALPFPGEFTMSYAGLLVYEGKLNWLLCILAAWAGTSVGMTLSYCIGYRLGPPFFEKYGARFHLGPDKLDRVAHWFQKYGNKLLIIAYFIPGVRHITGYFSGTTRMAFRQYAAFAYTGAFIWVSIFVSLGKILGPKWEQYHPIINRYIIIGGLISAAVFALVYVYRNYKRQITVRVGRLLVNGTRRFNTLGRMRFVLLSAFALFVLLTTLIVGLIQDFLAHEFALFDEVTSYTVHRLFGPEWTAWMERFAVLGSYYVFAPVIVITAIWISLLGKHRTLELGFFAFVIVGGEALDEGVRWLFQRTVPTDAGFRLPYTFPSEQTLLSLTVCGFAAFLLVRHYGNVKIRIAATVLVILLCLLVGVSRVFLDVQYPSDIVAGYAFGGAWLCLNIILLEVFRLLRKDGLPV